MNEFMNRHGTALLYLSGVGLGAAVMVAGRWAELYLAAVLVLMSCLAGQIDRLVIGPLDIRFRPNANLRSRSPQPHAAPSVR
jgi:hypothetical protein